MGPTITGGLVLWSPEQADEVLTRYQQLTESAPRELTAAAVVLTAPPAPFVPEEWHGKPAIGMLVCHTGKEVEADLEPLHSLGEPIVNLVGERPYVEQQPLLDDSPSEAKGMHQYWKTEYLPGLSAGYLDIFRESALQATSPLSFSVIFPIGGALNERADDDEAVATAMPAS